MSDDPKDPTPEEREPAVREPLPPMFPGGMLIDQQEEEAVLEVLRAKRLFRYYGPREGPSQTALLEDEFASHMGAGFGLAVTSGTAALICGLIGLGIGPGDEVIIPAYTWIATASAVIAVGAVPVMAEVDESLNLDPADLERVSSEYTRAVIPVHMRGAACRIDQITALAREKEWKVLEDAAQAHGGSFGRKRLGSWGDAGAFSLQFNKILTSGEGGMLLTGDRKVWERAVMAHDVVGGQRNHVPEPSIIPGLNFRMPELLAAVARVQLSRLEDMLLAMRRNKKVLVDSMSGLAQEKGVQFRALHDPEGETAVALIFYLPEREQALRVTEALNAEGAPASLLYSQDDVDYHIYPHWSPIMNQRGWTPDGGPWKNHPRKVSYAKDMCPRTLDLLGRAVELDVSPSLSNTNLEELCEALDRALRSV